MKAKKRVLLVASAVLALAVTVVEILSRVADGAQKGSWLYKLSLSHLDPAAEKFSDWRAVPHPYLAYALKPSWSTAPGAVTPDEAIGYLRQMHGEVPPEVLQRAAVATVNNLPVDQRKQFAEMLQRRQQGAGMVTIERSGQARATQGRDAGQGGGMDMDDVLGGLFGSMMGGGMGQPAPQPMPRQQAPSGGGMDDMLGGLLGTLLGGGMAQQAPQGRGAPASDPFGDLLGGLLGGGMGMPAPQPEPRQRQPQAEAGGGGIGDILGSPLGKAVLGGIAAYAMKEMMSGGKKGRG